MSFPPLGAQNAERPTKLSKYLTVPDSSVASTWPKTTIYVQDPSVSGWTCGSMMAAPRDVAEFFYHILDKDASKTDARPLISDSSRAEMEKFQTLTTGWMAGKLKYGAGLMQLYYGCSKHVTVTGHEGDTNGFLSSQGYVANLKAAYSIAPNVDNDTLMETMACYLHKIAQQAIGARPRLSVAGCQRLKS